MPSFLGVPNWGLVSCNPDRCFQFRYNETGCKGRVAVILGTIRSLVGNTFPLWCKWVMLNFTNLRDGDWCDVALILLTFTLWWWSINPKHCTSIFLSLISTAVVTYHFSKQIINKTWWQFCNCYTWMETTVSFLASNCLVDGLVSRFVDLIWSKKWYGLEYSLHLYYMVNSQEHYLVSNSSYIGHSP